MTLLHLITRLTMGGSARNTIDSAAACLRAGYRTLLATGPAQGELDLSDVARKSGCQLVSLPALCRQVSPWRDLAALFQTWSLLRRERVQIVHTHTSKAGFIGRLAASLARVPVVIHTPHGHIFHGYYGRFTTRLFVAMERLAARFSDRLVVLTDRGAEEHLQQGIGRRHQYVTIPSGVNLSSLRARAPKRERARANVGLKSTELVILGVGRLVPVKGFDVAIQAMPEVARQVPTARLMLLGEGPERERLEDLARRLDVHQRLRLLGASNDVAAFLAAADVLVAPSRNEGMGRALVEAMALGLPVVATRVGGIPCVVEDGSTGKLVPPEDAPALAAALVSLLRNATERLELGRRGQERAESFSLATMESRLLQLYREVAAEKGLPPRGKLPEPVAPPPSPLP
ncbi:MAG: glycosyltransferase family 4 protein [Acidobacteriota bacterium]